MPARSSASAIEDQRPFVPLQRLGLPVAHFAFSVLPYPLRRLATAA